MQYKNSIITIAIFLALQFMAVLLFFFFGKSVWQPYYAKLILKPIESTTSPKLEECQESKICTKKHLDTNLSKWKPKIYVIQKKKLSTTKRLNRHLGEGGFVFYPKKLTLIGMKHERELEVWGELHNKWVKIATYKFTAFSGILGPKIEEGDRQIPEGFYKITHLNPNSKFHLSLKLNYPNAFDRKVAKKEHHTGLGGDIMIHGGNRTIGCIPIGDESIEELYQLVKKVGMQNTKVILAPVDFRKMGVKIKKDKHPWLYKRYKEITKEMKHFTSK